jgi:hypothetical protein
MQLLSAVWSLIVLALISANLPFLNQRLFALIPLKTTQSKKSFWLRLVELAVYYFLLGGIAYLLEANIGNVFPQTWEFFAITVCLFIVFAFPGFVYQYLRRQ